ncbi:beta-hydroxyacyl-ACP dehydratase [bacterium]|nr:MAG: beta-hydroxyacyl-ACP dehydratase [bacterium]
MPRVPGGDRADRARRPLDVLLPGVPAAVSDRVPVSVSRERSERVAARPALTSFAAHPRRVARRRLGRGVASPPGVLASLPRFRTTAPRSPAGRGPTRKDARRRRDPSGGPAPLEACVVKFNLLDNVESIDASRIVATKTVSLAEEYLADHFPKFPVLPGVMMLEAITQAAGWLMHERTGFAKSMAVLKEAKNIKYGTFVAPGNTLRVEVEFFKETPTGATFKATSSVNGDPAISGRLEIAYFDLGDKDPGLAGLDDKLKQHTRARWAVLNTHRALAI